MGGAAGLEGARLTAGDSAPSGTAAPRPCVSPLRLLGFALLLSSPPKLHKSWVSKWGLLQNSVPFSLEAGNARSAAFSDFQNVL